MKYHKSVIEPKKQAKQPPSIRITDEKSNVQADPHRLNIHDVVSLQGVVGNAAVQRLIKDKQGQQTPTISQNASQPKIQRLMSFAEFQKKTKQIGKKRLIEYIAPSDDDNFTDQYDVFTGEKGTAALNEQRKEFGLEDTRAVANINLAYYKYDETPTLSNLILLYDTITYFETLYAGQPMLAQTTPILAELKSQIKAEVQVRSQSAEPDISPKTPKNHALKKVKIKAKIKARELVKGYPQSRPSVDPAKSESQASSMPLFLKDVGISPDYYQKNLVGNAEQLKNLEDLYNQLKNGHQYNATKTFQKIQDLPGMNSLRSLFLSRFPQQANMQGLVGDTPSDKEQETSNLTPEEITAIKIYSGASAYHLNEKLRNHDMRRKGGPMVGRARIDKDVKEVERRVNGGPMIGKRKMRKVETEKIENANRTRSTMELVVKGLNKLPQYSGVAYRIVKNPPASLLPSLSPGGVTSDLAFNSASPSMNGVFNYSSPEPDSIYYMIHAKSPANIVSISGIANEGEVLFKPGTRFMINHLWDRMEGKLPENAPVEVKMMFQRIDSAIKSREIMAGKSLNASIKIVEISEI